MNCEQVSERLPWWLNGTLDPEETRAVETHLEGCEGCRRDLADTKFAAALFSRHLPPGVLVDYGFGRPVAGIDAATIEEHLASCPRCATELELARESAWQARQEEGDPEGEEGAQVLPFRARSRPALEPVPARRATPAWRRAALAASLVGTLAAMGWWGSWQRLRETGQERETTLARLATASEENARLIEESEGRREEAERLAGRVEELTAPQPNVPVVDLFPEATVLRGEGRAETVEIPVGTAPVTLLLQPGTAVGPGSYELEGIDAEGRRLFLVTGLRRQSEGDFTVSLRPDTLPPELTLHLYGRRGEERRELSRYSLRLTPASP